MNVVEELTTIFEQDKMAIRKIILEFEEDYDIVDELMQDTFLQAWENREKFNTDSKLLTWVCGIAKNVARNYIRDKQTDPDLCSEETLSPPEGGTYTDTLAASQAEDDPAAAYEAQDLLDSGISLMPRPMAQVVLMRREGYSNPAIAKELSLSESRIRAYISEARSYFI